MNLLVNSFRDSGYDLTQPSISTKIDCEIVTVSIFSFSLDMNRKKIIIFFTHVHSPLWQLTCQDGL